MRSQLHQLFPLVSEDKIDSLELKYADNNEQMRLFKIYSELAKPSPARLNDDIIRSCLTMQSNRLYFGDFSEDDRNTFIGSMLEMSGYLIKDQTRRSKSETGKSAGEIDILIQDIERFPISIIEALNLSSVVKEYIITHINKIFTYDDNGLYENNILIYAKIKNFGTF